jgi:hypothetical protein
MQLRGILLHPSFQAITRAAVAAVMHLAVKCVLAMVVIVIAVELFFVFEFFSFVKHFSLSLIVTQVVTLSKSCYTLA